MPAFADAAIRSKSPLLNHIHTIKFRQNSCNTTTVHAGDKKPVSKCYVAFKEFEAGVSSRSSGIST